MNYWKVLFGIFGLLPLSFSFAMLAFVIHAAQVLGHPPSYNQPDPKDLDIYSYYSPVIDFTAEVWLISFPIWFALSVVYLILNRKNRNWLPVLYSAIYQLLAILIVFSGIFEWYVD